MQSLQIMEGLIGTACAIACFYYARHGALATQPPSSVQAAPWHSALGEYARRNPFAAVFGALAFGFLVSSWGMYISPRALPLPARTVEKWHVVTKAVPTADPTQTARIAALQTTISADATTMASQKTEIDRLKQLLGKTAFARNSAKRASVRPAAAMGSAETAAGPVDVKENSIAPAETAAASSLRSTPASAAPDANAAAVPNPPPPQASQGTVTAPGNAAVGNSSAAAPPNSAGTVPH
jgi:hypothetical protein